MDSIKKSTPNDNAKKIDSTNKSLFAKLQQELSQKTNIQQDPVVKEKNEPIIELSPPRNPRNPNEHIEASFQKAEKTNLIINNLELDKIILNNDQGKLSSSHRIIEIAKENLPSLREKSVTEECIDIGQMIRSGPLEPPPSSKRKSLRNEDLVDPTNEFLTHMLEIKLLRDEESTSSLDVEVFGDDNKNNLLEIEADIKEINKRDSIHKDSFLRIHDRSGLDDSEHCDSGSLSKNRGEESADNQSEEGKKDLNERIEEKFLGIKGLEKSEEIKGLKKIEEVKGLLEQSKKFDKTSDEIEKIKNESKVSENNKGNKEIKPKNNLNEKPLQPVIYKKTDKPEKMENNQKITKTIQENKKSKEDLTNKKNDILKEIYSISQEIENLNKDKNMNEKGNNEPLK